MKIQFSACKLLAVTETTLTTSPLDAVGARKVVDVASADEFIAAFNAYKAEIAATGEAAAVSFWRVKERGARAFKGFERLAADASGRRLSLVNVDAARG